MKLVVYNKEGKETNKKVDLIKDIYGIEPNDHAIYLDVKQYLASQRSGNHKTKERGEVKGSRRKIRKQKGSGAARVGDIKNPLFRGGGRVFGPRPKKYEIKLNKKVKRLARKSALTYKLLEKNIKVVEDFDFKKPSTKNFISILNSLGYKEDKLILVMSKSENNILLSSRNLKNSRVILASELNTYEILNAKTMLMMESSVKELEKNLKN